jgi:hypothetical protein
MNRIEWPAVALLILCVVTLVRIDCMERNNRRVAAELQRMEDHYNVTKSREDFDRWGECISREMKDVRVRPVMAPSAHRWIAIYKEKRLPERREANRFIISPALAQDFPP